MAYVNQSRAAHASLADRISAFVAGFRERATLHREYVRTYNELAVLSDRELADLGIGRSDIRFIAHEAIYGR